MERYNIISNIKEFLIKRSTKVIQQNYDEIENLQKITKYVIGISEMYTPYSYYTRSGCEAKSFPEYVYDNNWGKCDSIRAIASLIAFNLNEAILSISIGNYRSAMISLRSIFEWEIKLLVAITDSSVLTQNSENKNESMCMEGLFQLETWSNIFHKLPKNEKKQKIGAIKILEKDQEGQEILEDKFMSLFFNFKFMPSINKIIKGINPKLIVFLNSNNPENKLLKIYKELSNQTHFSIEMIRKLEADGTNIFYEKKEFKNNFNFLIEIYDIILYFFLLLIDLELFHNYGQKRINLRKELKEGFDSFGFNKTKYLNSTKKLLNSKEWSSNNCLLS